jgi:hypothetical protein
MVEEPVVEEPVVEEPVVEEPMMEEPVVAVEPAEVGAEPAEVEAATEASVPTPAETDDLAPVAEAVPPAPARSRKNTTASVWDAVPRR